MFLAGCIVRHPLTELNNDQAFTGPGRKSSQEKKKGVPVERPSSIWLFTYSNFELRAIAGEQSVCSTP